MSIVDLFIVLFNYIPIITTQATNLAGVGPAGYKDGPASSAQFSSPSGLSPDEGGNVFIADQSNNRIRRLDWITRVVSTVAGNDAKTVLDGVGSAAGLSAPTGLITKNGEIWVTDIHGGTLRHIGMIYITFMHILSNTLVTILYSSNNIIILYLPLCFCSDIPKPTVQV